MKIHDTHHVNTAVSQNKQKQTNNGSAFNEILDKTIDSMNTAQPEKTSSPSIPHIPKPYTSMPIEREEAVSRISQFLDIMEEYSVKLSSKKCSLKEIAPLVSKIETGIEELRVLSHSLPDNDTVKEILDQSLIRSSVEVIKFNRGDYL